VEPQSSDGDSVLGRLLQEISWEGQSVRQYRDGGRGRENVLTAEVLTALDFLPRQAFLGSVLDSAHGADEALRLVATEIEDAVVTFLPPEIVLNPDGRSRGELLIVQPDATITSASCYVMIEAKRIKSSRFQVQQLAREYLAVTREARHRIPLLLLVLGSPPPVLIAGGGRLSVHNAIEQHLPTVHSLVRPHPHMPLDELETRVDQACAWITWHELAEVVVRRQRDLAVMDPSVAGSIRRLTASIVRSITRHT
jgi:hypothetical protein